MAGPKSRKRQRQEPTRRVRRATEPASPRRPTLALVAPMLFASGCCALVFQVAWMRELRLVFGVTTAAVAAVLAVFMGGLGLGGAVLGRRAERSANPLRMYGLLEAGVALSVAASPWLILAAREAYIGLGGQSALGLHGASAVRLLLAAAVMGVPTFLMGGTLPAAVRAVTRSSDARRFAPAILYGVNTLGAVCGAALATFFALEQLGTRATLQAACAVNLLVGVIAFAQARKMPAADAHDGATAPQADSPRMDFDRAILYATAAVLGFTFFVLELVWYRMLGPILGGTTFTFGLILCVALLGIGVGGAAYSWVFRWLRPSWSALAMTCALEALAAAVPLGLGDRLALLAGRLAAAAESFGGLVWGWCVVMAIVVLPVALVSGLQFPLLLALLGRGRAEVGRQLGLAYAWNTLGAIGGSLVGGFGAMPLLSAPGTWRAVVVLLAMLSGAIWLRAWRDAGRHIAGAATVAALVVAAIACLVQPGPTAAWRHSGIGAGRVSVAGLYGPAAEFWLHEQRRIALWETDGIESSIGIVAPDGLSFVVNGKTDGNAVGDSATQIGAAILAAALHPRPEAALVIGLGTGESAGWLAAMPGVQSVEVVELEPAVDEMARRTSSLNQDVLRHPKVRRVYNDGREFILTTRDKFDVIVSEPSNPFRAGIATLYTTEFYRSVRDRLKPDGILLQWMQAYEVDHATVQIVLATLRSVFEHVEIWQTLPSDLLVVCSPTPRRYDAAALRERVALPELRDALRLAWKTDDLEGLLARFAVGPRLADEIGQVPGMPLNTDDRTLLEYGFAKTVGQRLHFSLERLRQLTPAENRRPPIDGAGIDWDLVETRRLEFYLLLDGDLQTAEHQQPHHRALVEAMQAYRAADYREAIDRWPDVPNRPPEDVQRLWLAWCHAALGSAESLEVLAPAASRYPAEAAMVRAKYFAKNEQWDRAAEELERFFATLDRQPLAIRGLAGPSLELAVEVGTADRRAARPLYERLATPLAAYRFELRRPLARYLLAEQLGPAEMIASLEAMEPNVPWAADVIENRAKLYAEAGHPLARRAARDWRWFQAHDE